MKRNFWPVPTKPRAMTVAGVMSGTSADGVDVAICRVRPKRDSTPTLKVLAHRGFAYPKKLREAVLAAGGAQHPNSSSVPELARLSWRLGSFYAECVEKTATDAGLELDLVSMHGQTIYHQAVAEKYLGEAVRCTWQIGEPSLVAERLRVPVVSDLRPADMAASGQGAPLVPMFDFCVLRHATRNRILLNLGGIANLTAISAGGALDDVLAFDTGPASMVIDQLIQGLYGKSYDRNGAVARRGRLLEDVVDQLAAEPYFLAAPPKSCGREEFGERFAERLRALCEKKGAGPEDVVATATAITVRTVIDAYVNWCWPHLGQHAPAAKATELIVAGGGSRNRTLIDGLRSHLEPLGVSVRTIDDFGIASEAKEAAAFALLGWFTWHGLPGNVPSATGASRAVVLGRVTLV